jgi:hypothetical protein
MEAAVMEAKWKQQLCAELVLEVVEVDVMESRMRLCKELILETVVTYSWEVLEVNRLMRETKEDGVDRLVRLEDALRMERERIGNAQQQCWKRTGVWH